MYFQHFRANITAAHHHSFPKAEFDPALTDAQYQDYIWWVNAENTTDDLLRVQIANSSRIVYICELAVSIEGKLYANFTEAYEDGLPDMWYELQRPASPEYDPGCAQLLIGHWECTRSHREDAPATFDFQADHTCQMDDTAYTWEYNRDHENSEYHRFRILDSETEVAFVNLHGWESGVPYLSYKYGSPTYMKPEH